MRTMLAALAMIGMAQAAQAALYTYEYQGETLFDVSWDPAPAPTLPGLTMRMVIDSNWVNGGMANARLSYSGNDGCVRGPCALPGYLREADFGAGFPGYAYGGYRFSFDEEGRVLDWFIEVLWEGYPDIFSVGDLSQDGRGGDEYVTTTDDGDRYLYRSAAVGTWTLVSVAPSPFPPPAPIPLPASAATMLLGVGALALAARRRRA